MSISGHDVRRVAALARIGVEEKDIAALVTELNGILAHMEVLQGVSLPDDSADAPGERSMPLRADQTDARSLGSELPTFAPITRDGFFLVPRLATHGAAGSQDAAGAIDEDDAS